VASGSTVAERGAGWLAVTWPLGLAASLAAPVWLWSVQTYADPGASIDPVGDGRTRLTVRLALLYYALALGLMLFLRREDWEARTPAGRLARCAWTLGWLSYLVHLTAAFHYYHHWSHADAVERTGKVSGFGGGIFVSHLFTLLWTADVAWWWLRPGGYAARSGAVGTTLHGFMLFIVFNATMVYETGFIRWAGAAGLAVLGVLALLRLRSSAARQPQAGDI
jgi:hypothetical protein